MKNELEIVNKLEPILNEEIDEKFEIILVEIENDLQAAKKNIKEIQAKKKDYKERILPYKSTLNNLHKMVTAKEKEVVAIYDDAVSNQKIPIAEYNQKVYEEQQRLKRIEEERARAEEERIRQEEIKRIAAEKDREEELTISQLENLQAEEQNLDNIKVQPEKVISKKDEVRKKYEYSISDVNQFIIYALSNNRRLLRIEPNLIEFKRWVKRANNSEAPFVEKTEKYI